MNMGLDLLKNGLKYFKNNDIDDITLKESKELLNNINETREMIHTIKNTDEYIEMVILLDEVEEKVFKHKQRLLKG